MPRPAGPFRRLATVASWPFGVTLTSWHYMWRTTPLHRREGTGSAGEDGPPPLPEGGPANGLQPAERGVGPLFHRRYAVQIRDADVGPEELMARIAADPNVAAPTEFARFRKVSGDDGRMRVGDEYLVRMPGPWDGPVRVVAVTPTSFRLATLQGHLEAGQIEFRAGREAGDGNLTFTIESWARSGDRLSKLLYQTFHMAKEVQFHMWTSFLERVVKLAGGRMAGGLDIETRRVDGGEGAAPLDELRAKALNYELGPRASFTPEKGWRVDEYCQPLTGEPPGEPVPGGPWEHARRLMRDYEFADPEIVRAVYDRGGPLEGRDMLLEARWHGLRFRLGVRVGGVVDETRDVDGRRVRVWGWNYRTLQGHLEMGQMDYEVWKWVDTGDVEFRICCYSRRARIANPVVSLGFRLFGRREQVRFARRACERMAELTSRAAGQAAGRRLAPV